MVRAVRSTRRAPHPKAASVAVVDNVGHLSEASLNASVRGIDVLGKPSLRVALIDAGVPVRARVYTRLILNIGQSTLQSVNSSLYIL